MLPTSIATTTNPSATNLCVGDVVEDGQTVAIHKSAGQKLVASDHVPTTYLLSFEEPNSPSLHQFIVLSFNVLATANVPFCFWDTAPQVVHNLNVCRVSVEAPLCLT